MDLDPLHYINLAKDGTFAPTPEVDTTPEEVDAIFAHLEQTNQTHLVFYFHGGLVGEAAGLQSAKSLVAAYRDQAGTHPVFVIWESSLPDMLRNLEEAGRLTAFIRLFNDVNSLFRSRPAIQGELGLVVSPEQDALTEPQRAALRPVTAEDEAAVAAVLMADPILQAEVEAIVASPELAADSPDPTVDAGEPSSAATYLSTEVLDDLQAAPATPFMIGPPLPVLALVPSVWRVFGRVVARHIDNTDHGIHCTIVEEILREIFVGAAGTLIWNEMKRDIQQAFDENTGLAGPALHGGTYILERLRDYLQAHPGLKVSLVGHSAGAIYICRLLQEAPNILPASFSFKQVIFLAPGVDFTLFQLAVVNQPTLVPAFRMFGLSDELEQRDVLVRIERPNETNPNEPQVIELGWLYPRSLLYLVSGLLEGEPDKPLVGMQRFFLPSSPHNDTTMQAVKGYLETEDRVVWSIVTNAGPGLNCAAESHGGFGAEPVTLKSIVDILNPPVEPTPGP